MELSIDTSTNIAGIALSDRGEIVEELTWQTYRNHTIELIPQINSVLENHGLSITDISAVNIAKGPGSFNGLRVGMAFAKGIAYSLEIPIIAIGTLEAIAIRRCPAGWQLCAIVPAGRNNFYSAKFKVTDEGWMKIVPEYSTNLVDLCQNIENNTLITGEFDRREIELHLENVKKNTIVDQENESTAKGRAGYLAKLGWCRIINGDFDNFSTIQPLYLKNPSITQPKRRL